MPDPNTGCWEWQGVLSAGYGQLCVDQKMVGTHVIMFVDAYGYRPPTVMHKCDNRKCCNPEHLQAGTPKMNTRDMWKKGRHGLKFGPEHPANRLDAAQVIAIRAALVQGVRVSGLAEQYGVSRSVIYDIRNGRRYKWVASGEASL